MCNNYVCVINVYGVYGNKERGHEGKGKGKGKIGEYWPERQKEKRDRSEVGQWRSEVYMCVIATE